MNPIDVRMTDVFFHGELGERFGDHHHLNVHTVGQIFRCFDAQCPDFRSVLAAGDWHVVRGSVEHGVYLTPMELELLPNGEVHVIPAIHGSGGGSGSSTKIIIGAALVVAAVATWQYELLPASFSVMGATVTLGQAAFTVGAIGFSMALGGISQLLAPQPKVTEPTAANSSFLISGLDNVAVQGGPVPLIYGEVDVGSVVITSALDNDQLLQPQLPAVDPIGTGGSGDTVDPGINPPGGDGNGQGSDSGGSEDGGEAGDGTE